MRETSAMISLHELRRLEEQRVADEKAEADALVSARERADSEATARAAAEARTRDLEERMAKVAADAEVARARFDADRARFDADRSRFEATIAQATAQAIASVPAPIAAAPPRRWPMWTAIAASLLLSTASAWSSSRPPIERPSFPHFVLSAPSADAAPTPPLTLSEGSRSEPESKGPAAPRPPRNNPPPKSDPPKSDPPKTVKLCDPSAPLGCLQSK